MELDPTVFSEEPFMFVLDCVHGPKGMREARGRVWVLARHGLIKGEWV